LKFQIGVRTIYEWKHISSSHNIWKTYPLKTTTDEHPLWLQQRMKATLVSHTRDAGTPSMNPQGMNTSFEWHKQWITSPSNNRNC